MLCMPALLTGSLSNLAMMPTWPVLLNSCTGKRHNSVGPVFTQKMQAVVQGLPSRASERNACSSCQLCDVHNYSTASALLSARI